MDKSSSNLLPGSNRSDSSLAAGSHHSELRSEESSKTSIDLDQLRDFVTTDFQAVRSDLDELKNALTDFVTHASRRVVGAASNAADKSAVVASRASNQVKTLGSELETVARENPIGAMSAALALGVLIGLVGRGRT
jgi:hypothetical protein